VLKLSSCEKKLIYDYVSLFGHLSDKFSVDLWAIGGTLLGAIRDQDVIEWDDDVDYAVREEDLQILLDEDFLAEVNRKQFTVFVEKHKYYETVYHIARLKDGIFRQGVTHVSEKEWKLILEGRDKENTVEHDICSDVFLYRRQGSDLYNLVGPKNKDQTVRDHTVPESDMIKHLYKFGSTWLYSLTTPIHSFPDATETGVSPSSLTATGGRKNELSLCDGCF
jgi:hypothetical protein